MSLDPTFKPISSQLQATNWTSQLPIVITDYQESSWLKLRARRRSFFAINLSFRRVYLLTLQQKTGAESPTTARELDWDDDETHENATPSQEGAASQVKPASAALQAQDENPPPKPPRPMSPQAQAEATLIEAFPDMDSKVVKAVLMASGGKVEPAFNALLGM